MYIHIHYIHTQSHSGSTTENPSRGLRCGSAGETNLSDSPLREGEHSTVENLELGNEASVPGPAIPPRPATRVHNFLYNFHQ